MHKTRNAGKHAHRRERKTKTCSKRQSHARALLLQYVSTDIFIHSFEQPTPQRPRDENNPDAREKNLGASAFRSRFETTLAKHTYPRSNHVDTQSHLIPPSTAVMATRCLWGRFTRMRITLDVKYVPISMDSSNDSTCAGIENLLVPEWGLGEGGAV